MRATPAESGIEWVRCTISISNGPASAVSPIGSTSSATSRSLCSSSFERAIATVS